MSSNSNSSGGQEKRGFLILKMPHWLVQVRIFDNAYRLIQFVTEFTEKNPATGYFEKEVELSSGIYEIEVAMGNRIIRELINIKADRKTEFVCEKEIMKAVHQDPDSSQSQSFADATTIDISWQQYKSNSAGDANLCVHMQLPKNLWKENLPRTDSVFNLLHIAEVNLPFSFAAGHSVINYEVDPKVVPESGEIIINKDLPAGYYIVEWISMENHKSYQPLYLHRGWSTRIFICTHIPVPNSFYMSTAAMGKQVARDNEEEMAAKAILETLGQDLRQTLVLKDKMKFLLSHECQNPWLGVLAAYAIIPDISKKFGETSREEDSQNLLAEILDFLNQRLPDHPDVQALNLVKDIPTGKPFHFPPLLYKGLQRVNKHAEGFEDTVPIGSLTDMVLQSALMNTPWVNWRRLANADTETKTPSKSTVDMKGTISPKAPVIVLSAEPKPDSKITENLMGSSETASISTLNEVSMINTMQELTKNNLYHGMPDNFTSASIDSIFNTLNESDRSKIVNAIQLPLSRINAAISSVMQKKDQHANRPGGEWDKIEFSGEEQLIIRYALQEATRNIDLEWVSNFTNRDSVPYDESVVDEDTIEECFFSILTEAGRIVLGSAEKSPSYLEKSVSIAKSLRKIALEILKKADFIATTSTSGKIIYGNGAFKYLSSDLLEENTFHLKWEQHKGSLSMWEEALRHLPLGNSKIDTPVVNSLYNTWEVKRSALQEKERPGFTYYINVLRGENAGSMQHDQLQKIAEVVSTLELFAPLCSLYSSQTKNEYMDELDLIVDEFHKLLQ